MRQRVLALFLVCPFALSCADFCAVKVLITDGDGRPTSSLVQLLDSHGNVVARSSAPKGEASFCDFDFGTYSIHIGGTTCAQVVIPSVSVHFGHTQVFKVFSKWCDGSRDYADVCRAYFRVQAKGGDRLADVVVTAEPAGPVSRTDQYGRLETKIPEDETRTFIFSKEGFQPERVQLTCPTPTYIERKVELQPARR